MSSYKYTIINLLNSSLSVALNFFMPAIIGTENSSQLQTFRRNLTTISPLLDLGNCYEITRCGWKSLSVTILVLSILICLFPVIVFVNLAIISQDDASSVLLILCGLFIVFAYNCIAMNVSQKKLVQSAWINLVVVVVPTIIAIAIYKIKLNGLVGYMTALFIVAVSVLVLSRSTIEIRGSGSLLENIKYGLPKAISGALETAYILPIINAPIYHESAYKIVFFSQVGRFIGGIINSNLVYARANELGLSNRDLANFGLAIIACGSIFFAASFILPEAMDFSFYSPINMDETTFLIAVMLGSMLTMAVSGYLNLKLKTPLLGILNLFTLIFIAIGITLKLFIVEWVLAVHILMLLVIVYRIFKNERI